MVDPAPLWAGRWCRRQRRELAATIVLTLAVLAEQIEATDRIGGLTEGERRTKRPERGSADLWHRDAPQASRQWIRTIITSLRAVFSDCEKFVR
jgi:hypothetical protein